MNQFLGRLQEFGDIRKQGLFIPDHLELDPVGAQSLSGKMRREHRLLGRVAARRVRQDLILLSIDQVERAFLIRILEVHPADRNRDEFHAARLERVQ